MNVVSGCHLLVTFQVEAHTQTNEIHDMHIDVTDPEWVANGSIMADVSCETVGRAFFLHQDHILGE